MTDNPSRIICDVHLTSLHTETCMHIVGLIISLCAKAGNR